MSVWYHCAATYDCRHRTWVTAWVHSWWHDHKNPCGIVLSPAIIREWR